MRHRILWGLLACLVLTGRLDAQEMKAGVAKTVITNTEPLVMVNGNVSEGTLNDIVARALVLNDGQKRLVILTYDLNCLDHATPILRQRLKDELGIEPAFFLPFATHNHSAPIQINPNNFAYGKWLASTLFDLIRQAIANERGPVHIQMGQGDGVFLKSLGSAPVDYEIQLLQVMEGTEPLAMLFTHGTHPLQASEKLIEAGHPGQAMNEIEARTPGVQAMYAASGAGNQFPLPGAGEAYMGKNALERCQALGHELAEAVLKISQGDLQEVTGSLSSRMIVVPLPLAAPISKEEALDKLRGVPKDVGFVPYPDKNRPTNWLRMLVRYYDKKLPFPTQTTDMICSDDTYLIHKTDQEFLEKYDESIHDQFPCVYEEVIVARIGSMPWVAMQGEICAPIVMRVKDAFRRNGPILVQGYMGEHNLYIPTRELVRVQSYQAKVIQTQYASPVGWSPEVEDEMVKAVIGLVNEELGE